jgi:chromosome segregation ATPase
MTDSDHIMQLRQQVANLHELLVKAQAERDQAKLKVERIMEGLEGTCMTCEPVGVRNQQMEQHIKTLQAERDEARREVCKCNSTSYPHDMKESHEIAESRGWCCFKEKP